MMIYVLSILGVSLSVIGALLTGIATLIKTIKKRGED